MSIPEYYKTFSPYHEKTFSLAGSGYPAHMPQKRPPGDGFFPLIVCPGYRGSMAQVRAEKRGRPMTEARDDRSKNLVIYRKLMRDRIPEIIRKNAKTPYTRRIEGKTVLRAISEKSPRQATYSSTNNAACANQIYRED